MPDLPDSRRDMALYHDSVADLDRRMGVVLDALRSACRWDDTLIICTTDHGIAFPEMKCSLRDTGIGVMLIIRDAEMFSGGKIVDGLVSHVDVVPTLADYLGFEPPGGLEGVTFLPLVDGRQDEVREAVYSEVTYHASHEPKRCIRTKRWKYIQRFGSDLSLRRANCDDSLSKDIRLAHGWGDSPLARESLYDMALDPGEARDLATEGNHAKVLGELREALNTWMKETRDPLLENLYPSLEMAMLNPVRSVSPRTTIWSGTELHGDEA